MKRKGLVVLALLVVASLMAAMGTGALDVFSAKRSSAMTIVNDAEALIGISGGEYTKQSKNGKFMIDFNDGSFIGNGLNPQAKSEFHDVFTITNQSAKTVYVWLEAEGWSSEHNAGLKYVINRTNGSITKGIDTYATNTLLNTTGWNFKEGKGSLAYVQLDPGEYFTVNIYIDTVLSNGYGDANTAYSDWSHGVIVKANETAPSRP